MTFRTLALLGFTALSTLHMSGVTAVARAPQDAAAPLPLSLVSARVTILGTSNVHEYTASSSALRLTRVEVAGAPAGDRLAHVLAPGGLGAFDVAIAATTLTSPKEGIDKNMHKALKVQEHPDIRFRLIRIEAGAASAEASAAQDGPSGAVPLRAIGTLSIAGVDREVTLDLQAQRTGAQLSVVGGADLLMTDFGISPPKAMLGLLKTSPNVRVELELVLAS